MLFSNTANSSLKRLQHLVPLHQYWASINRKSFPFPQTFNPLYIRFLHQRHTNVRHTFLYGLARHVYAEFFFTFSFRRLLAGLEQRYGFGFSLYITVNIETV